MLSGCSDTNTTTDSIAFDNDTAQTTETNEPEIDEEALIRSTTIESICSMNAKITDDFANWLYENYPEESVAFSNNENVTFKSELWRANFGKSYYVLKDEYKGLIPDKDTAFKNNILMMDARDSDDLTLAFAGDICFEDGGVPTYRWESNGIKGCFSKELISLMKNADMFMANNEFTLTDRGEKQDKTYTFRGNPKRIKWIKKMGVDVLSLANNHAYDFGKDSFVDTYNNIQTAGILLVGGGSNLDDATTLKYVEIGGIKIAIIAATQIENWGVVQTKPATEGSPGVLRCADETELKRVCKMIKKASKKADYVVVYPHWGIEYEESLQEVERIPAKAFAKAGADVILGGHPHCMQGVEYFGDTACCYSLSNFIFNSKSIDSTVITIDVKNGKFGKVQYHPCKTEGGYTWLCNKGDSNYNKIISIINNNSADNAGVDEDGVLISKN